MDYRLTLSKRIKSTPFTSRNDLNGVKAYTVYNKTLLPTIFDTLLDDYYHLLEYVQLWDVSCQKIIQIKGPDASHFLSLIYAEIYQMQNRKMLLHSDDEC